MEPRPPSPSLPPALRLLLGLLGAGAFGTGVVAVFVSDNGTGTGVLLAFGGIVLVVALLGNRMDSVELGGAALRLRAAAADRFSLAEQSERRGDTGTADRLRAEAQALLEAAGPVAADYRRLRGVLRAGPVRTRVLDEVLADARRLTSEREFDPVEVRRWLLHGSDEERVTALAMMQAAPPLRDFDALLIALAQPHSPFEQYHAMLLAGQMVDGLDAERRHRLAQVLRARPWTRLGYDTSRRRLRRQILDRLTTPGSGPGTDAGRGLRP